MHVCARRLSFLFLPPSCPFLDNPKTHQKPTLFWTQFRLYHTSSTLYHVYGTFPGAVWREIRFESRSHRIYWHDLPTLARGDPNKNLVYAKLPLATRRFLILSSPGAKRRRSALKRHSASSMFRYVPWRWRTPLESTEKWLRPWRTLYNFKAGQIASQRWWSAIPQSTYLLWLNITVSPCSRRNSTLNLPLSTMS